MLSQAVPFPSGLIKIKPEEKPIFANNYNKTPFVFEHNLHQHPLFSMPSLLDLAQYLATIPGKLYYNVGQLPIEYGWDMTKERPFSAQEALERIESADAWMILRGVQDVPEYAEILSEILREIHETSGRDFERFTKQRNISIIITSPSRVTPYHMDGDCNYLVQIHGRKDVYVFDGNDRSILPIEELERFWVGDINAATYRPHTQEKAMHFDLTPGTGVHVPVTFPHWVQNGTNVSVSASINFVFVDRSIPNVHRINHYLRKAGMMPTPPGQSVWIDKTKIVAANLMKKIGRRSAE